MASLIDDADKADMQNELINVFDTFKRPLTVYLTPQKVVIATNPNYSMFGDNSQNSSSSPTVAPQPVTIYGVIRYKEDQQYPYFNGSDAEIKVKTAKGRCRVKVMKEDADKMMYAKDFQIDGFDFRIDSTPRPHGLFAPAIYTFYLQRSE